MKRNKILAGFGLLSLLVFFTIFTSAAEASSTTTTTNGNSNWEITNQNIQLGPKANININNLNVKISKHLKTNLPFDSTSKKNVVNEARQQKGDSIN